MGLFDFFKKNKDVLTDNGMNYLLHDNGKLKEKFEKVNGIINGEYFKYDESGEILSTDFYHNGHIISIEEKQSIDAEKQRIENSKKEKTLNEYKNKILKLIEIDKTIFDVAYGNLIVQMTNVTLLDFSKKLSILFQDYFDEEFLKIYLFYKRNYLIDKLIRFEDDEINLNQIFTDYLNSKKTDIDKEISKIGVYVHRMHINKGSQPHNQIIGGVFFKLNRTNNNNNLITSLSKDSFNDIDKSNNISNQDCELIGLEIDGYITINRTIKSIGDKINEDKWLYQDKKQNQKIQDKIFKDILSICKQYRFYQGGIEFNLENLNAQNLIKSSGINNLSATDLYERGIEKDENSDYEGAIEDFTKAIEIDNDYIDAYRGRASSRIWINDYEGVVNDYSKIIELNIEDIEAYRSRGLAKASLKDYKGAIEDYNKTIELDKESKVYSFRGRMKKNLLDYDGAMEDYNIAVEKFPEDDSGYFGRGELKYEIEDYLAAIKDFNKCIELKPARIIGYHKRGDCKLMMDDYNGAIEDYSKVIQYRQRKYDLTSSPSGIGIKSLSILYLNRGIAKQKIGEFNESILDLKKSIELDPNNEEAKKILEKENEEKFNLSYILGQVTFEDKYDMEDVTMFCIQVEYDECDFGYPGIIWISFDEESDEPYRVIELPDDLYLEENVGGNYTLEQFDSYEEATKFINNLKTISFKKLKKLSGYPADENLGYFKIKSN